MRPQARAPFVCVCARAREGDACLSSALRCMHACTSRMCTVRCGESAAALVVLRACRHAFRSTFLAEAAATMQSKACFPHPVHGPTLQSDAHHGHRAPIARRLKRAEYGFGRRIGASLLRNQPLQSLAQLVPGVVWGGGGTCLASVHAYLRVRHPHVAHQRARARLVRLHACSSVSTHKTLAPRCAQAWAG